MRKYLLISSLVRFFLLILIFCGALSVKAQQKNGAVEKLGQDFDAVTKRGVLRVAIPSFQSPPFFVDDAAGVANGFDVDLAKGFAKSLNVNVEFIRSAKTFNDAVSLVQDGSADVAICKLSRTLARAKLVSFSEPYLVLHHALAINRLSFSSIAKGRDVAEVVRDFEGSIGVIEKSSFEEYAIKNFPKARVIPFKDWTSVVDALRKRQVDAIYRDELEIKRLIRVDPVFPVMVRTATLTDTYDSIGAAFSLNATHLVNYFNLFLAQNGKAKTANEFLKENEGKLN